MIGFGLKFQSRKTYNMSRYETTDQYRDRYWRKVLNRSTIKDRIIQTQIEIDRQTERTQKVKTDINKLANDLKQIIPTLEKNNEKMSNS